MANLFDELKRRGLYADCTDTAALREHLQQSRSVYCGFDPTADSLHIGHLIPVMMLKRFQMYGHTPILLIGGATALVGDPAGRTEEREFSEEEVVKKRAESLKKQVTKFLDFSEDSPNKAIIVDNYSWLKAIDLIEFLRDYGKISSLKELLANRYVRARLEDPSSSISFAEFTYTLLQAIDFVELYKKHSCTIQFGGTDQWGNITNGTRLARGLKLSDTLHGITLPLLLDSSGVKFGKTEGGKNIWLNPKKTPVFDFYQYWFTVGDNRIEKTFYTFSLKSKAEIDGILKSDKRSPESRLALRALAFEVTEFVHGRDNALACQTLADILFPQSKKSAVIEDEDWQVLAGSGIVPVIDLMPGMTLVAGLRELGLAFSKTEARQLLKDGGITLNLSLKPREDMDISEIEMLSSGLICLQKGKSCGIIRR